MTKMTHHIPDAMLQAYAAGNLSHAFSMVVATHVSMCDACRAALEAHHTVGGVLVEEAAAEDLSADLKDRLMAQLDTAPERPDAPKGRGIYPGPVIAALKNGQPKWRSVGMGVKQSILSADESGSVRLLHIPPGQAVPDHGHNGIELTLVLQGSFSDETGQFGVGDVEVADETLEHTPIADPGLPCICLAATDAPLRFSGFMPRLLQPLFKI